MRSPIVGYVALPLTMLIFWLVRYVLRAADAGGGWLVEVVGWTLLVLVALAVASHWRRQRAEYRRREALRRFDEMDADEHRA